MLIGRHSALALFAGLALSSVACSQVSGTDAEASASAESQSVDASSLITVSADLPYEVKRMHPATGRIFTARWGQHGGPVATLADDTSSSPIVTRWWLPKSPNSPAAAQPLATAAVPNLPSDPESFFWNNDGFLDTPDGALMAWSSNTGNFTGELIQFSKNYDQILSRGSVNGYYSGASVTDARFVYSGLSGITAQPAPETKECGLWASDITATQIVPATPSTRLVKWEGSSGPVTTDSNGNVFVAAFVTGAAHSNAIYALGKNQALASEAQTPATLAETDTQGTSSIAAASIPGTTTGWLFAKGWDTATAQPIYARQYTSTGDAITAQGEVLADAIKPVISPSTLSMFTDPKGNLWVTVTAETGAWLIELEPKAP
ncbi:MAG: hypothetical protein U0270_23300 [Labilithrix sp.]